MKSEQDLSVKSLKDSTDIFNYVIDHLRKQGCQSLVVDKELCAYRGDGGTMCAVGALITDDEYNHSWEGIGIDYLINKNLLPSSLNNRIYKSLHMLLDLQNFHDNLLEYENGAFTEDSEIHINNLSEKWGIK